MRSDNQSLEKQQALINFIIDLAKTYIEEKFEAGDKKSALISRISDVSLIKPLDSQSPEYTWLAFMQKMVMDAFIIKCDSNRDLLLDLIFEDHFNEKDISKLISVDALPDDVCHFFEYFILDVLNRSSVWLEMGVDVIALLDRFNNANYFFDNCVNELNKNINDSAFSFNEAIIVTTHLILRGYLYIQIVYKNLLASDPALTEEMLLNRGLNQEGAQIFLNYLKNKSRHHN